MPIIAVMILFYGSAIGTLILTLRIYLTDRSKFPLQLILREILVQNDFKEMAGISVGAEYADQMMVKEGLKYAIVVLSTPPPLLYPLLSRFFEKGIMVGAYKG